MTTLTQAPNGATGRNPQAAALAPQRATPNLPDGLALWAGREEFLTWCRERGVKGQRGNAIRGCLVASALRAVTGQTWYVGKIYYYSAGTRAKMLPRWLSDVIQEWLDGKLPEFTEC